MTSISYFLKLKKKFSCHSNEVINIEKKTHFFPRFEANFLNNYFGKKIIISAIFCCFRLFTLKRKHYNEYGVGRRQAGAPTGYHFGGDDGEDGNEDGSYTGERVELKKEEGEEVGGGGEDEQEVFGGKTLIFNFNVFNLRKNAQKIKFYFKKYCIFLLFLDF
jgi:hypothetical protein